MIKTLYIYFLLVLLSFGVNEGYSQNNNPFELKSRSNKNEKKISEDKSNDNVFNIKNSQEDTSTAQESKIVSNNPFDLGAKRSKSVVVKEATSKLDINNADNDFNGGSGFLFWVLLIVLVFVAVLLSINRSLITKIIKVVWYYNHTNTLFRNFGNREFLFYILLFINFTINLAIFIYLYLDKNHNLTGINLFVKIFVIVTIVYVFKHASIYFFNKVFSSLKSLSKYNFTIFLFNIALGLFLIPINLFSAYGFSYISSIFIIFGIVFIVIFYLLRLFRGLLITYDYFSISIFHFFLYLCTFEILPLLFLSKYFANIF